MSIISWNCRGLGNPRAIRALSYLLREKDPMLVFLIETKKQSKNMDWIICKISFDNGFYVDSKQASGGLALFWNNNIKVRIESYSSRHIDSIISNTTVDTPWRFTGLYGNPITSQRHHSWQLLRRLDSMNNLAWLCVGDFNEIVDQSEKQGGSERNHRQMKIFKQSIDDCGLCDLGYTGNKFTWSKGSKQTGRIFERLDRALASLAWCSTFPNAEVLHLPSSHSDHLPLLISTNSCSAPDNRNRRHKKPIKFEELWIFYDDCQSIIKVNWCKDSDNHINSFKANGARVLQELKAWSNKKFGSIPNRIRDIKNKLKVIQYNPCYDANLEAELRSELENLLEKRKYTGNKDLVPTGS